MRFRTVLAWVVIAPLTLSSLAVIGAMYINAQRRSAEMGGELIAKATNTVAQHVAAQTTRAAELATSLAALAHDGLDLNNPDRLGVQLLGMLRAHAGITWISFSAPDGRFTGAFRDADGKVAINQSAIVAGKTRLDMFYVSPTGVHTPYQRSDDSGYDPRVRPFYVAAENADHVVWIDPYIFFEQGVPGISCALAVRGSAGPTTDPMAEDPSADWAAVKPSGALLGVFSIDYDLNQLHDFTSKLKVSPDSRVIIFTPNLTLIAHSELSVIGTPGAGGKGTLLKLSDVDDPATAALTAQLTPAMLAAVAKSGASSLLLTSGSDRYIACVTPVQIMDGPTEYVATIAPRRDFDPPAWQFNGPAIVIVAITLAAGGIMALLLATRISQPLSTLASQSQRIGAGEFDLQLNLGSMFEFRQLATALQTMLNDLRDWVRVRRSLDMAMDIQRSLLPRAAPKFPPLDIAGFSKYCDETGGDYFDYIPLGGSGPPRLLVVLGDVMGHGLPSAMTMAGARGVLRSDVLRHDAPLDGNVGCDRDVLRNAPDALDLEEAAAQTDSAPAGVVLADGSDAAVQLVRAAASPLRHCDGVAAAMLCHLNELLNQDTDGKRFMTMCLFIVDAQGRCDWASAGHDPPIIYNPRDKQFSEPAGGGFPLGMFNDSAYRDVPVGPLAPGDVVFIGSDGVWETFRADGEQFGKERVREVIAAHAEQSAEQIKTALAQALDDFRGAAESRDDVTFVLLKFPCRV